MRRPDTLRLFVWAFLLWWFLPILFVVRASFSSVDTPIPSGLSLRWYGALLDDAVVRTAFSRSLLLAAITAAIATPLGCGVALWIFRARSRVAAGTAAVLVTVLLAPQVVLATALFVVFTTGGPLAPFPLGTPAQLLAHVTLAMPYVVAILWIRLITLEPGLQEMAMDLGATELSVVRRVLVPLAAPAIAMAALVAAVVSFENLVLSEWLCLDPTCRTVPMLLYRGGAGPPPMRSALATAASLVSVGLATATFLGVVVARRRSRSLVR